MKLLRSKEMKKKIIIMIIPLIVLLSSCGIAYYETAKNPSSQAKGAKVIINAIPDSAQVLLEGRKIGYAYEFSSSKSALKLSEKKGEITIKKQGYLEKSFDLKNYKENEIVIDVELQKDNYLKGNNKVNNKDEQIENNDNNNELKEEEIKKAIKEEEKKQKDIIVLKLIVEPQDATIYINDNFWGVVPNGGVISNLRLFNDKKYKITIMKPGYISVEKNIVAKDIKNKEIKITLQKTK